MSGHPRAQSITPAATTYQGCGSMVSAVYERRKNIGVFFRMLGNSCHPCASTPHTHVNGGLQAWMCWQSSMPQSLPRSTCSSTVPLSWRWTLTGKPAHGPPARRCICCVRLNKLAAYHAEYPANLLLSIVYDASMYVVRRAGTTGTRSATRVRHTGRATTSRRCARRAIPSSTSRSCCRNTTSPQRRS